MARFEGSITFASMGYQDSDYGKICGAVIGRGGSGIKALTAKFPGLFVKVYDSRFGKDARAPSRDCDSIHISGRSTEHVQEAAVWIASTAKVAMDGTLAVDTGPKSTATCPSDAVGAVIGRGGGGIRTIQDKAGDHCHVHYNRDSGFFEISASTQAACDRAKIYIGNAIKEFFQPRREERPASRPTSSSIGFSQLAVEGGYDSEDELTTAVDDHKAGVERAVITAHNALENGSRSDSNSIQSRKSRETPAKERWAIREELAKKSDPCTGDPLYAPFSCQYRGWVTGKLAVPWRAVDEVIEKRQKDQDTHQEERSAKRAKRFETRSREEQRQTVTNGLSNDSLFPSLSTGSKSTAAPSGWGSKPSSVVSNDGVEELNKAAQTRRFVAPTASGRQLGLLQLDQSISLG
jgi:transcription antitermination factor NusA-like protein